MQSIQVFDRFELRRKRARYNPYKNTHGFLFDLALKEFSARLDDIKRTFEAGLLIGNRGSNTAMRAFKKHKQFRRIITMDLAKNDRISLVADEEFLPFLQNSFDCIFNLLTLHSINDLPGALIQINRALKPDGLFMGALFGGETLFELRQSFMKTESLLRNGISPRVFPFADKKQMGDLMQRAGFALPVIDSDIIKVSYQSVFSLMQDLQKMGEGNIVIERSKTCLSKEFIDTMSKFYSADFGSPDGTITASFEIIYLIGWAPHKDQQKPLRPGSATVKLADILKTEETIIKQ